MITKKKKNIRNITVIVRLLQLFTIDISEHTRNPGNKVSAGQAATEPCVIGIKRRKQTKLSRPVSLRKLCVLCLFFLGFGLLRGYPIKGDPRRRLQHPRWSDSQDMQRSLHALRTDLAADPPRLCTARRASAPTAQPQISAEPVTPQAGTASGRSTGLSANTGDLRQRRLGTMPARGQRQSDRTRPRRFARLSTGQGNALAGGVAPPHHPQWVGGTGKTRSALRCGSGRQNVPSKCMCQRFTQTCTSL